MQFLNRDRSAKIHRKLFDLQRRGAVFTLILISKIQSERFDADQGVLSRLTSLMF
jgi:hypothetical protein